MKKITTAAAALGLLSFLLMTCGAEANAQLTMRIDSVHAKKRDTVNVPVSVANFSNIGAISLKIKYSPAGAKFIGVTGAPAGVIFIVNAAKDVITLAWFDATGHTPMNLGTGVLMNIRVVYRGGYAAFSFDKAKCEIADAVGTVIPVSLLDGAISPRK